MYIRLLLTVINLKFGKNNKQTKLIKHFSKIFSDNYRYIECVFSNEYLLSKFFVGNLNI